MPHKGLFSPFPNLTLGSLGALISVTSVQQLKMTHCKASGLLAGIRFTFTMQLYYKSDGREVGKFELEFQSHSDFLAVSLWVSY